MKKILSLIFSILLLLTSCNSYKELDFQKVNVANVSIENGPTINLLLNVTVNNPTSTKFTLTDCNGTFFKNSEPFADFVVAEPVVIKSKTLNEIELKAVLTPQEARNILSLGLNLTNLKWDDFTVDGIMNVKTNWGTKTKTEFKNKPLKEIVDLFKQSKIQ